MCPQLVIIWILTGVPLVIGILVLVTPNTKTTDCVKQKMNVLECTITCIPINKTLSVDCHHIDAIDGLYYNYFDPSNYGFACLAPLVMGTVLIPLAVALNMIATFLVCVCCPSSASTPSSSIELSRASDITQGSPGGIPNIPIYCTKHANITLGVPENSEMNRVIIVVNPKN